MSNKSVDPFRSTFSLLAGQGSASQNERYSCHIEPLPDDMNDEIVEKPAKKARFIALIVQLVAMLKA